MHGTPPSATNPHTHPNLPRHFGDADASVTSGSSGSLKDGLMSIRRRRNEEYARLYAQPKIRSNISSDKLQWDGHRSSFPAFANDLEAI